MSFTTNRSIPLLLPGQAAAPDGPVDMTVMYVMHHGFRRDLARFAAAIPATPIDDGPTWTALRRRWDTMAAILHHHHTAEDAGVWPVLRARASVADLAHLAAMEDEHHALDPLLDATAGALGELVGLVDAGRLGSARRLRDLVAEQVNDARRVLSAHLDHEEREAIAIIQRHLTQAEWTEIEKRHFQSRPAPAGIGFLVSWFLEGIPADQVPTVIASVGAPVRVIWALRRRAFRRGEHRAFRHA